MAKYRNTHPCPAFFAPERVNLAEMDKALPLNATREIFIYLIYLHNIELRQTGKMFASCVLNTTVKESNITAMAQMPNTLATRTPTANAVGEVVSAVAGAVGQKTGDGPGEFEKLISALLGAETPTQPVQSASPIQSQTSIDQSSSLSLESLIDIEALLSMAQKIEKSGEGVDPLAALLDGLVAKLNEIPGAAEKSGTTPPVISKDLSALTLALSDLLTTIENTTSLAAQQGTPADATTKIPAPVLDQLLALNQALRGLQPAAAETQAAQLDKLIQQTDKLIQSTGTANASAIPSGQPVDADANNIIALLFGKTETGEPTTSSLAKELQAHLLNNDGRTVKPEAANHAALPEVLATANKASQAQLPIQQNTKSDTAPHVGTSVIGKINTAPVSTTAATPHMVAGARPGADTLAGEIKQDPLLLAQSQASTGQKADFAAQLRATSATYNTPTPNLNMPHIAVEIARNLNLGNTRFQIRLDPPEMGKINVTMDMDSTGNLHARLTVERAETLDLLQRDARALERALAQSGLDSARTNLEFSLKQNPFNQQNNQGHNDDGILQAGADDIGNTEKAEHETARMAQLYRGTISPDSVNLWV